MHLGKAAVISVWLSPPGLSLGMAQASQQLDSRGSLGAVLST